jgi:hypothetical protein
VSSTGAPTPTPNLPPFPPCRSCHLLRKHALLPFAAPAGLGACARCTFAFTAHCAALEASHGLQLVPTVQRELWPVLEQVRSALWLDRLGRGLGGMGQAAVTAAAAAVGAGGCLPSQADKLPLVLLRIRVRIRTCIFPSPTLPHSHTGAGPAGAQAGGCAAACCADRG